ncbi:prolyl oligopeptidase family serine peptidase [Mangrovimonas sp. AS39]|uniref:prolyl oligopeptidase family serine peptidase n=2 Tax=Mangrovimonas futianensis TaxID=2895523 RepID=UPI001E567A7F|nr:prolyl oligopeptidase family serine peptidase [Mangrovimonas futianensis]MCF1190408.1 prolyl oligopeptidase family serine peptidase [Mangrovimonas futianensis]
MDKTSTMKYPETKKGDSKSTYFGAEILDPYRWLEDDQSKDTKDWVKAQNEVTNQYLNQIDYRNTIAKKLKGLWDYEKVGAPFQEGNETYYYKNNGVQNHSVLYRKREVGDDEVFLDPNSFSKDGTKSLSQISFTKDGSLAAYSISEGGSDWRKVVVIDTQTKEQIGDTLVDIKFSQLSWKGNEGFYYSSYDKPKGSELSSKTDQHKVYYHKIGTKQRQDLKIYGFTAEEKHRYIYATVTKDNRYLILTPRVSTSGNKLFLKDLQNEATPLLTVLDHCDSDTYLLDNNETHLFLYTNLKAPNGKIVMVDARNPTPENWIDLIPETEYVLTPSKGAGFIFAEYMTDAICSIKQYQYDGALVRTIDLPGKGSTTPISGKENQKLLYYSFTNYMTPNSIYEFDPTSGISSLYWQPKIDFNSSDYTSEQVFYRSKDGTKIPMVITYKKGLKRHGKNPTMLYGYGGFNISLTPAFSVVNAVWLDLGGIYAVPNLRGGGEYGKNWHISGTQRQKQNVFDDFIAAAEYLIEKQYTASEFLAISGRSNGGLLVGTTMTQRPDLMKVALPGVGVLDMLRYHTFTAGAGWAYDYGTAEDSEAMFNYLLGYSPVHNVKNNKIYPATLITTADHDDRVVPAHSYKFAAELQQKQTGENPVLIRIDVNAGHGEGKPISLQMQEWADIYGFTLFNMGYKELPAEVHEKIKG